MEQYDNEWRELRRITADIIKKNGITVQDSKSRAEVVNFLAIQVLRQYKGGMDPRHIYNIVNVCSYDVIPMTQEEKIESACRTYGEKWRDILYKKWSYFDHIWPEQCYVFRVEEVGPNISEERLYNSEEEAKRALIEHLKERIEKIKKKFGID